ncbi:hypothetical protein EDB83DRAFT_1091269 [Lactarius deliciosus]|nr:hypothetical protein EDB83DRAFT_1091269 [Lactarius deliciosus]
MATLPPSYSSNSKMQYLIDFSLFIFYLGINHVPDLVLHTSLHIMITPDVTLPSSGSIRVQVTVPPLLARSSRLCSSFRRTRIQELDILLFLGLASRPPLTSSTSATKDPNLQAAALHVGIRFIASTFPTGNTTSIHSILNSFPRPVSGEEKRRRTQEHISE